MDRFKGPNAADEYGVCDCCGERMHYLALDDRGNCPDCADEIAERKKAINNKQTMKKPTAEEIVAELATLKKMKPDVLKTSAFGDDNHDAIDAQIKTLEMRKTEAEIYNELADDAGNVLDAALEAARWMKGESEDGAPSEGWKPILIK